MALHRNDSASLALVFLLVALASFFCLYVDASAILARTGMVDLTQTSVAAMTTKQMRLSSIGHKRAMSEIIGKMANSLAVGRWIWLLSIVAILVFLAFASVVHSDSDVSPTDRP